MFRNIIKILILGAIGSGLIFLMTVLQEKENDEINTQISDVVKEKMEYAYYEGQKDALEGDIRIEKLSTGEWVPIKSVWNVNTTE